MDLTMEERRTVYDATGGYCHLCRKKAFWTNYGKHGKRGAWEVDHSNARANGGTDRLQNLKVAHTSCNRSKQDMTTRAFRARNGFTCAPASREKRKSDEAWAGFLLFLLVGWFAWALWKKAKTASV